MSVLQKKNKLEGWCLDMDKNRNLPGAGNKLDPDKVIFLVLILITLCTVLLGYAVYLGYRCSQKEAKVQEILTDLAGGNLTDFQRQSVWCRSWCVMSNGEDPEIPVWTKVYK